MKIIDCDQRSPEWFAERSLRATASELGNLISQTLVQRKGATPHTYRCKKLAERWIGRPIIGYSGGAMEQGSILEDEAIPWYELRHKRDVRRVGLVISDDGLLSASPDGLSDDRGLEIKCPQEHTHVSWLLDGGCPPEHFLQVQGGMYATGLEEWDFVSYCRAMPPLVVRVKRDQKAQEAIELAVQTFDQLMRADWDKLTSMYGQPDTAPTIEMPEDGLVF